MLQLKNIFKTYYVGDTEVPALKGVSIDFRESEFVSILGPSGCGKTTLLNLIGGLDRYTDGDLVINGVSTKEYKDSDWDLYRNHSIGFVFQSYNLIPHQSVLSNVELALTLSGVSKSERKKRAKEALEAVGLGDQIHKRPNQMSGGQMQRVAIARALVNDPDILLADEPTGALDTETSVQIMDILKNISKDRLIIMVTHNPDLAEKYSTRIINLLDGQITGDSNPYTATQNEVEAVRAGALSKSTKKPSMSFFTALSLSLNNLMTKKARTFLTAFAGSIGIIGIALILSLSNGITNYIGDIQRETLSSYPITIQKESTDMSSLITSIMGVNTSEGETHENDKVYSNAVMYDLMNKLATAEKKTNNLGLFKKELLDDYKSNDLKNYVSNIQYVYDTSLNIYVPDNEGNYVSSDITEMFSQLYSAAGIDISAMTSMAGSFSSLTIWEEMLPGDKDAEGKDKYVSQLVQDQYELIYGEWPDAYDEVMLVVTDNNEVSDITLYTLGLMSTEEMQSLMVKALTNQDYESTVKSWEYKDICDIGFKLLLNSDYYKYNESTGLYDDIRSNDTQLKATISHGVPLKIVGILRPSPNATVSMLKGSLVYTSALTDYIIDTTAESDVVKAQTSEENKNRDVITGMPFNVDSGNNEKNIDIVKNYLLSLDNAEKKDIYLDYTCKVPEGYTEGMVNNVLADVKTREDMLKLMADNLGMSMADIESYLGDYTDEQIKQMLTEAIVKMVEENYITSAKEAIINSVSVPDEKTMAQYKELAEKTILSQATKEQFIILTYQQQTNMPVENIGAYVMALSKEEIDARFDALVAAMIDEKIKDMPVSEESINEKIAAMYDDMIAKADNDTLLDIYDNYASSVSYERNLRLLGVVDKESPRAINIYAATFEDKDNIAEVIGDYNDQHEEDDRIEYTDYVAIILSSITTIINVISYVLIAFVSISLVVSSIMIGIITYISVLERTKEIGVLRSIGASKRDVSRVFNAETMIVGLAAGLIGIAVTVVLCIPISLIVQNLSGIYSIRATLPLIGGIVLVLISVLLTLIAGVIPSRVAAKKDPVVALRSE